MRVLKEKQSRDFLDLAIKRTAQYIKDNNLKGITLGISGGVDSAEVYDLAEFLGLPPLILESKPADGLKVTEGSLAEHQLGLNYLFIDYIMGRFIGQGFDYNGSFGQLKQEKYKSLLVKVAHEVKRSTEDDLVLLKLGPRNLMKDI